MFEKSVARAPYNFVPFSDDVFVRYKSEDEKEFPRHDEIRPDLKSGEIHVTMTAETPVFVSDGHKRKTETGKEVSDPHFFRTLDGKYALPGSTIRGMVRANMRILGFGLMRTGENIADSQLYYRSIAARSNTPMKALSRDYNRMMGIAADYKTFSGPQAVKSGYLVKTAQGYRIIPTISPYMRVSRDDFDKKFKFEEAKSFPVAYLATGKGNVEKVVQIHKKEPGMSQGILLCSGRPVRRPGSVYIFPAADRIAIPIELSQEDILRYMEDLERRRNTRKEYIRFWELPKSIHEEKPVFYLQHEGRIYFGMTRYFRVGYQNTIGKGLPKSHIALKKEKALDYPSAILGYAGETSAYKSRVFFDDFCAEGGAKESFPISVVLGEPKASYYVGYLKDGKHYNCNDFQLRGHKQYWLKGLETPEPPKNANIGAVLRPLPKGTRFHGVIRYKNLYEDELGLLLWSLCLEKGCFQQIGMGKPYGYGRMSLTINSMYEYDYNTMYSAEGLCNKPRLCGERGICDYIQTYQNYALEMGSTPVPVLERREIRDFLFIRSTIRKNEEVQYMGLREHQDVRNILPSIENIRKAKSRV